MRWLRRRGAATAAVSTLLVAGMLPATYAYATPGNEPDLVEAASNAATVERLIVRYAPKVRAWSSVDDVAGEDAVDVDLQAGKWIGFGFRTLELPEAVTEAEADRIADDLRNSPDVLFAEPDLPVSIAVESAEDEIMPDAVQTSATWGLDRIDQRSLPLNGTYEYTTTGDGVRAYIIDTGVLSTHTEFTGRMAPGFTSINDGLGTEDCDGHGTHVAGTVAGTTYGVAKDATVVPVRVLDCEGSGTSSTVVSGMNWVRNNHPGGPAVVNMSLGGGISPRSST
jgi:Subtilisin-like serine proteases